MIVGHGFRLHHAVAAAASNIRSRISTYQQSLQQQLEDALLQIGLLEARVAKLKCWLR